MSAGVVRKAEPLISWALRCIETDLDGVRLVVADDLRQRGGVQRSDVLQAWKLLEDVLSDPNVSNAELKGLLNRTDVAWSVESPFGANAQAAREHLEAARDAMQRWAEQL
jgi:hypothetical protein